MDNQNKKNDFNQNIKNQTSANKQNQQQKSKEEIRQEIERVTKRVTFSDKFKIYINSFKWQAKILIFFVMIIPMLNGYAFSFLYLEMENVKGMLAGTQWLKSVKSYEELLLFVKTYWELYINIFNFGYLLTPIITPSELVGVYADKDKGQEILLVSITYFFLTMTIFQFISKYIQTKQNLTEKGGTKIDKLTTDLRKKYKEASTMKGKEKKAHLLKGLKKVKDDIFSLLGDITKKHPDDPEKIYYQSGPIFKIMVDEIDSPAAGRVASITNKYWIKEISKKQKLFEWGEVVDFLFKWQFSNDHLQYIEKLNILKNPKVGIDIVKLKNFKKKTKKGQPLEQYTLKEQKIQAMKMMCVASFFKNYPKYTFLEFFELQGITFDKFETKAIINATTWINAVEKDQFPSILPMPLLLPKLKTTESTMEMSKLVYETLGVLVTKMPLLQNQAIGHVKFDVNSPYLQTYSEVESLIVDKVFKFIELLFFNLDINFKQMEQKMIKEGVWKKVPVWSKINAGRTQEIQKRKEFSRESKEKIIKLIKNKLEQNIKGVTIDFDTGDKKEEVGAELQVAKLKEFMKIEMFVDFFKDFLGIANTIIFLPQTVSEEKGFKKLPQREKDLISDMHLNIKKQIVPLYKFYYDTLKIKENIRMIKE